MNICKEEQLFQEALFKFQNSFSRCFLEKYYIWEKDAIYSSMTNYQRSMFHKNDIWDGDIFWGKWQDEAGDVLSDIK